MATYLISIGNNIKSLKFPAILRASLPMTSKADKLPLETEPVARDNNTIFTLQPRPGCSKPNKLI